MLATAEYQAGARVLARMGLSLDTGVCFPQLPEVAAFAKALPDLTIILNHLGGLTRTGPYANRDNEVLDTWRKGIAGLADCRNVYLKLGGIGMPRMGFDWHTRDKPIGSEELATAIASQSRCQPFDLEADFGEADDAEKDSILVRRVEPTHNPGIGASPTR